MYSLSLKDVFEKEDQKNIEKGIEKGIKKNIEKIAKKMLKNVFHWASFINDWTFKRENTRVTERDIIVNSCWIWKGVL